MENIQENLNISPEKDDGNIEYKTKLLDSSEERIQRLASQMRYRTEEGFGESIYVIGVSDSGDLIGLDEDEFNKSFNNLLLAAKKNNYTISIVTQKKLNNNKKVYELLVRENNEDKYIDIKVAVAGSVDAGKSSFLSVLTNGKLDNGRGSARLSIFNFPHEVASGRTSSIAHHILGFDDKGKITNYSTHKKGWSDIVRDSRKIISFYDLCGHEKYLKTTILGLSSSFPDMCFIMIGGNMGITRITQEHIFLCVTMGIPFSIVITKIDICKNRTNVLKETVRSVKRLLKLPGIRRIPYNIYNKDDVITCTKNIHSESIVPIFYVSNVTGEGLDYVKILLNLLRKTPNNINNIEDVEYHIDTIFYVQGVGTVVGGQLISGTISVGDRLLLGPNNGKYTSVQVRSIHCKRVPVQKVEYGSYVCLGLRKIERKNVRKGNVLLSMKSNQLAVREFDADITVVKSHSTSIKPGYEPIVNTNTMRQTATLLKITNKINARKSIDDNECILRTGDKATARFRFRYRSEYLKSGSKLLMTEGKCKIIGTVR
jgi:GTPase